MSAVTHHLFLNRYSHPFCFCNHKWKTSQNKGQYKELHLGIISKLGKLHIIQEAAGSFNDIFALLWGFLHFTSQEKTTSSRHLSRHISHHYFTITNIRSASRSETNRDHYQIDLHIWETAWRSETCRSGGNIWCPLPVCHSVWMQVKDSQRLLTVCKISALTCDSLN